MALARTHLHRRRALTAAALASAAATSLFTGATGAMAATPKPSPPPSPAPSPAVTRTLSRTAAATPVPASFRDYVDGDRTDTQWALTATRTQAAWAASTGTGVVVATLDTGADRTNPDLVGQLLPAVHLDPTKRTVVTGDKADVIGHGTHVAGVIVGRDDGHGISGVAPGAKVLPINLSTYDAWDGKDLATAITYATTHGAKVISMSLSFGNVVSNRSDVTAICKAVAAAVAKNVVIVAAAGNDGEGTNSQGAPAMCPGAISVASVDSQLRPSAWSSFDATVTVAAPGQGIYSSVPTSVNPVRYQSDSGTSMATPFVAGVAALILAQHPDWTPAQVKDQIVRTATDLPPAGVDPRSGAGLVNPPGAVGVDATPAAAPFVDAAAEPYLTGYDKSSRPLYSKVLLHWVPDPTLQVTGYTVVRYTAAGVTSTDLPADTVRATFGSDAAGYRVVAHSASGDVPSAPIWFPLIGQDMRPIYPVSGLHAAWGKDGSVTVTWSNPSGNSPLVDQYAVMFNSETMVDVEKGRVPTKVVVPASKVPTGDLEISVMVGSTATYGVEETTAELPARLPFSGNAYPAGSGRYRVELQLAASRRTASSRGGTGLQVNVIVDGVSHWTRLDKRGYAVVVTAARATQKKITVSVSVPGSPKYSVSGLKVPVSG